MKRKNIIIFLNAFWNNGRGMSGGDQMMIQIFKRIRDNFNRVICYTNLDGRKVISDDVERVEYRTSPRFFDQLPLILNYGLRTLKALGAIFQGRIDIVYGGSDFFPDVIPAFLYKFFHPRTKWVQCVFHIYPHWRTRPGSKIKSFIAQYLQRFSLLLIRKADTIVNINYQVRKELVERGFKSERIVVNPPGIEYEYFTNLRPNYETPNYIASFLARLNPSKGIFDLIEIWKRVVWQLPEAKLAIIGGGSDEIKGELRKKAKETGLENNIDILGFLENDEAFQIIKKSRTFILPSHEEGFGIVIAEAMACGTPAISWNLKVYEEIFEDFSLQIEENDMEAFAQEIIKIVQDQDRAKRLSQRAYDFVQKYSWDGIAKRHWEILDSHQK